MTRRRLVGVLGGMGPAATIDFMAKVIAATPATLDQDHVPLLVYQATQIPDRPGAIRDGTDAPFEPMLKAMRVLEQGGAETIVIACNTAHYWYDRLASASRVPMIHIADAVLQAVDAKGGPIGRIALLATRATIATGIYDRLKEATGELLIPEDAVQMLLDQAIAAVKRHDLAAAGRIAADAADRLVVGGADRLLLACTELPIAFAGSAQAGRLIDATEALARSCVAASLERGLSECAA